MNIYALTIIQPYAHLIAIGRKRVENRGWPTRLRGPIAIHAGKARKYHGVPVGEIAEEDYSIDRAQLAFGAVIAIADLIACVSREDIDRFARSGTGMPTSLRWLVRHEHAEGPWCFVLDNIRPLELPIVVTGAQGFWKWQAPPDMSLLPALERRAS